MSENTNNTGNSGGGSGNAGPGSAVAAASAATAAEIRAARRERFLVIDHPGWKLTPVCQLRRGQAARRFLSGCIRARPWLLRAS